VSDGTAAWEDALLLRERPSPGFGDRQPVDPDQPLPRSPAPRSRAHCSPNHATSRLRSRASEVDSVLPFGLPASIRNASRWSMGIAMPVP
jgi:hypothetical protein